MTRPIAPPRGAADRIWRGSGALSRRYGGALARWVRAGRRDDLKGPAAALGPVVRLALLAGGALAVYGALRAAPVLLWPVTAVWCWRAWKTATPAPSEPQHEDALADDDHDPAEDLARWLLTTMPDRPGIHLRDLYPLMRQLPGQATRSDAYLRAALRTRGVPVVRSLRIGRVAGRSGVRKADLVPLLYRPGERPGDSDGDAGQSADSPAGERVGEELETA